MTDLDSIIKKQRHYFANKGPSSQGYGFSSGHVWMWELDHKEGWVPKNSCFQTEVLEKTLESLLGSKEIKPSQSYRKSTLNIHRKYWSWNWSSNTLAIWWEELTYWKRPWCWERLKAWGEGDNRGWDGWMASLTRWIWVWASFGSWWWTGKPGMLQSMGLQSQTQLSNWTELNWGSVQKKKKEKVMAPTPVLWPLDTKNWLIGKDPDSGKDWRQEEKGTTEDDGWMASPTQWTWIWVNSRRWWRTGKPGVLQSTGLQRVRYDWATEQQQLINVDKL